MERLVPSEFQFLLPIANELVGTGFLKEKVSFNFESVRQFQGFQFLDGERSPLVKVHSCHVTKTDVGFFIIFCGIPSLSSCGIEELGNEKSGRCFATGHQLFQIALAML